MLQAMHYIHSKGTAHRDLKPENIMLDDQFNVRIADFGFAAPTQGRDGSGTLKTHLGTQAYMAPEILAKEAYQGHVVDLFALGIILFILYSGHPPFQLADPRSDSHYKLIASNRADLFWKTHEQRKPAGFYSDDFKDLITNMLQLLPNQRLSMADIIGHPWMQGEMATREQVKNEFDLRQKKINKQRDADTAARLANKAQQPNQGVRRGDNVQQRVVMAGDNTAEETKEEAEMAAVETREIEDYEEKAFCTSVMFSEHSPREIIDILISKLKEKDVTPVLHEKKWKLTFERKNELDE